MIRSISRKKLSISYFWLFYRLYSAPKTLQTTPTKVKLVRQMDPNEILKTKSEISFETIKMTNFGLFISFPLSLRFRHTLVLPLFLFYIKNLKNQPFNINTGTDTLMC